jgi:putative drug exporter of the RND superfamily
MMRSFASFVTGRRTKWLVVAVWIVLVAALLPLGSKLGGATNDSTEAALPKGSESTAVLRTLRRDFPSGQTTSGTIVYERAGGLTPADRAKIVADAARAARELPVRRSPSLPFAPGKPLHAQVSESGTIAFTVIAVPNDQKKLGDWGKKLRAITGKGGGGLKVYVTGDLGFSADFEQVFGSVDTKVLIVTVSLVLVLLLLIYRALLIPFIPLIVVGFAYSVATAFIYLLTQAGATVNRNTTTILVVLMFGVGTDYCLLLVSRYREELRRNEDKHDAMARALRRAGPAILASGLTVAATMLVLLLCKTGSLRALGPAAAIGVSCSLLAGLTLLPALLTIVGRRGFWPRRRLIAFDPEATVREQAGLWRRLGDRVLRRPVAALVSTTAIFAVGGLGLLAYKETYSTTSVFTHATESVAGFKAIEKGFPSGSLAPIDVIVERADGPVRPADIAVVSHALSTAPGVAGMSGPLERSRDGHAVRLQMILTDDPFTAAAFNRIPGLRTRAAHAAPGVRTLMGASSATQYDFNHATARDLRVIIPTSLLVIGIILGILLQAVVAPLVLIASVVVSFFGTLGLSILIFRYVFGEAGVDNSLPVFAFIFLVSLGIDYTIFLMSRVREEARRFGTREGVLRALSATGPVITSAGIILAGTFSVLLTLPVWFIINIGFIVALGILLDTFVVRTIMVPAAVELIGDRVWWPSTARGGGGLVHEAPAGAEEEREPATRA